MWWNSFLDAVLLTDPNPSLCLCVSGGSIKDLSAADKESLQASWWDRQSVLPLRGRDILRLIECGLKYDINFPGLCSARLNLSWIHLCTGHGDSAYKHLKPEDLTKSLCYCPVPRNPQFFESGLKKVLLLVFVIMI